VVLPPAVMNGAATEICATSVRTLRCSRDRRGGQILDASSTIVRTLLQIIAITWRRSVPAELCASWVEFHFGCSPCRGGLAPEQLKALRDFDAGAIWGDRGLQLGDTEGTVLT
jgi:hypothetical protein